MDLAALPPGKARLADLPEVLAEGWQAFRASPLLSAGLALPPALLGWVLFVSVAVNGVTPLVLPLAGGFMLVGPALLAGFFSLRQRQRAGLPLRAADGLAGFTGAPAALWVVAALCAFLFLIWITDAATLYAMMVGAEPIFPWREVVMPGASVRGFYLWSSVGGAVIAFITFALSAFSVPLLYHRRAGLANAVVASVKAVLRSLPVMFLWGAILTFATVGALLLPVVFPVVLPVLAYASDALYRRVFPDSSAAPGER